MTVRVDNLSYFPFFASHNLVHCCAICLVCYSLHVRLVVPDNVSSLDVARYYGDGAKYKSVWDRMNIINKNAKAIAAAVDAGQDPFAVPLDDTQTSAKSSKTKGTHGQLLFESSAHRTFAFSALAYQFYLVSLLISLDISARFGGDCTKSAIENRFRRLKSDAKLINDAVKNGVDPITINVGDTDGRIAISGSGRGNGQTFISPQHTHTHTHKHAHFLLFCFWTLTAMHQHEAILMLLQRSLATTAVMLLRAPS